MLWEFPKSVTYLRKKLLLSVISSNAMIILKSVSLRDVERKNEIVNIIFKAGNEVNEDFINNSYVIRRKF